MTATAEQLPDTAPDPLVIQVRRTHEARSGAATLKAALDLAQASFDEEHAKLLTLVEQSQQTVQAEETALRELTLQRYEQTGDKRPSPGVGIRIEKLVEIASGAAALEWAKTSGMALMVDVPALKKIAIATPISCATVHEVPRATIATDLGEALGLTPKAAI